MRHNSRSDELNGRQERLGKNLNETLTQTQGKSHLVDNIKIEATSSDEKRIDMMEEAMSTDNSASFTSNNKKDVSDTVKQMSQKSRNLEEEKVEESTRNIVDAPLLKSTFEGSLNQTHEWTESNSYKIKDKLEVGGELEDKKTMQQNLKAMQQNVSSHK